MLYSSFSQGCPKLGGKLHALWALFCSPYAPWGMNIAVWWGLGLQPLCSDAVFSLSRPQLSSRNCVPWACTFQHTSLPFWVPGAFNALVTLRVPPWYAGSCRTCKAEGMLLQACFWTDAPCQCIYCSRTGVCVAALGMRSGTLCEVIFTQPPWLSNFQT